MRHLRPSLAEMLDATSTNLPCGLLKIALFDELDARKIEVNEVPGAHADTPGEGYPGFPSRHRTPDSRWRYIALGNRFRRPFLVRHLILPAPSCVVDIIRRLRSCGFNSVRLRRGSFALPTFTFLCISRLLCRLGSKSNTRSAEPSRRVLASNQAARMGNQLTSTRMLKSGSF